MLLRTFRADLQLCSSYRYASGPPLRCPITALGGRLDPLASPAQMLSWREQTGDHFDQHTLPGGHFYLRPAEARVLTLISMALPGWQEASTQLAV